LTAPGVSFFEKCTKIDEFQVGNWKAVEEPKLLLRLSAETIAETMKLLRKSSRFPSVQLLKEQGTNFEKKAIFTPNFISF
jgi:hypothetical protein